MKYVAAFLVSIAILAFWLWLVGRVGPLLAQQTGTNSITVRPLGQSRVVITFPNGCLPKVQVDCLEYDKGKCIHSKMWSACWNPLTNDLLHQTVIDFRKGTELSLISKKSDAPGGCAPQNYSEGGQ